MEIVVLSDQSKGFREETGIVTQLFKDGLQTFHLRKPRCNAKEIAEFIESIPPFFRDRIILHSHHSLGVEYGVKGLHLSQKHRKRGLLGKLKLKWFRQRNRGLLFTRTCHKLSSILEERSHYDHILLSSVLEKPFNTDPRIRFSRETLMSVLKKSQNEVYALGGVDPERIGLLRELGFKGAVLASAIWNEPQNAVEEFRRAQKESAPTTNATT